MISQTTTEFINGKEVYRKIPAPCIPAFPVMSWASLFPISPHQIPSLFQSRWIQYFTAGRYALYQALKEINVKKNDEILVPAYHCPAMIYPIIDAGCIPVFYKINEDFSTNITDLNDLITSKSKAVIAVNYFGFFQNIQDVRKICDKHKLKLVEDCAHSLFGQSNDIMVGQTGDYAIGSTKKFFSVEQGGILTSNKKSFQKRHPGKINIKSEIRFIYQTIERSIESGRLWMFTPFILLIEKLRGQTERDKVPAIIKVSSASGDTLEEYSAEERISQPTRFSMFLEKYVSHHRIHVKRRENYIFLLNALKDIQGITIPIKEISAGYVPYMLPIIIENMEDIFAEIEDAAIPFQRFGQFLWQGAERCTVSQKYAKTILQLPCHQELTKAELQWIVDRLNEILDMENTNDS